MNDPPNCLTVLDINQNSVCILKFHPKSSLKLLTVMMHQQINTAAATFSRFEIYVNI